MDDFTDEQALVDALAEHFPTGLRSSRGHLPQTGEVFESPIRCECHCGEAFAATDEQEARQLWAIHAATIIRDTVRAEVAKRDEIIAIVAEAMGDVGWNITLLSKVRPLIRALQEPTNAA